MKWDHSTALFGVVQLHKSDTISFHNLPLGEDKDSSEVGAMRSVVNIGEMLMQNELKVYF